MHVDPDDAIALTFFAAATLDVETETARTETTHSRGGKLGVEIAYVLKDACEGGGITPWCSPEWGLINGDDLSEIFFPSNISVLPWSFLGLIPFVG